MADEQVRVSIRDDRNAKHWTTFVRLRILISPEKKNNFNGLFLFLFLKKPIALKKKFLEFYFN